MDTAQATFYLEEHEIKPTANRILILRELMKAERPLSLSDLEIRLRTIDKSNVSRALSLFRAHHLLHVIDDGSDCVKYEICHHPGACDMKDLHVHFHCEVCHTTYCLEDTLIPQVELPEGYQASSINYVVKGVCAHCRHRNPKQ